MESTTIGAGTRIWAFTHVLSGAVIGRDCNIGDHCYIESGVTIGDGVTIKNGVALWDGIAIHHAVFVGPGVVLTNDRRPRSRADWTRARTVIEEGATIGANATIVCGLTIGAFSFVGAGSVVTRDVPSHGLVYGNPARVHGYVCSCAQPLRPRGKRVVCGSCHREFIKRGPGLVSTSESVGAAP